MTPLSTPAAQGTVARGPYRAEFGAIIHEDVGGFLFTVSPPSFADDVAKALNAKEAPSPEALPASGVEAVLEQLRIEAADDHYHDMWQQGVRYAISEMKDALASLASDASPRGEAVAWQWRSRIKGGAWDAWERGRYNGEVPPFAEIEERALYAHPAPATVEMREAAIELLSHLKLYVMEKLEGIDADMLHDRMYGLTAALAPATEGRKG